MGSIGCLQHSNTTLSPANQSQRARPPRGAGCTWREAPISLAAQEPFQHATDEGEHAVHAPFCSLDGIFRPQVAATVMQNGL